MPGFNEAAAPMLRKAPAIAADRANVSACFNEAAAPMLRKDLLWVASKALIFSSLQ